MNRLIFIVIPFFFLISCMFKEEEEIITSIDCPKHFIIGEASRLLIDNSVTINLNSNIDMNCYTASFNPDRLYINITNNLTANGMIRDSLFQTEITLYHFVTNRENDLKILEETSTVAISNLSDIEGLQEQKFLPLKNSKHENIFNIDFENYKQGVEIFSAIR